MSTIQKIVDVLQKINNDKQAQLDQIYCDNSAWLANEVNVIQQLINQNPRDHLAQHEEESSSHEDKAGKDEDAVSRKRKSPEEAYDGSRSSPDQKRSSSEFDAIASAAGLPSDLSKLKKEQLLVELENRGNNDFNMKTLKNIMVDALKEMLLSEHGGKSANTAAAVAGTSSGTTEDKPNDIVPSLNSTEASLSTTESSVSSNGSPSKRNVRKGSLLSDFRSMVNNPTPASEEVDSNSAEYKSRIENEFQARQNRHRDSQARKSQIMSALNAIDKPDYNDTEKDACTVVPPTVIDTVPTVAETGSKNTGIAYVYSPKVDSKQPAVAQVEDGDESEDGMCEVSSPMAAAKELKEQEFITKSASKSNNNSGDEYKQPVNLVGNANGATSFVGGTSQKALIPALEKAKQAKLLEEQKQAQKKKEQEQRMAAKQQTQQQPVTPAPAKKGIFGFIKKATTATPAAATTSATTTTANPIASTKAEAEAQVKAETSASDMSSPNGKTAFSSKSIVNNVVEAYKQAKAAASPAATKEVPTPGVSVASTVAAINHKLTATPNVKTPLAENATVLQQAVKEQQLQKQSIRQSVEADSSDEEDADEYQIEDRDSSDDSGSGTDSDDDEGDGKKRKQQNVPEWARGQNLKEALDKQYGLIAGVAPMDPDAIFYEVVTCSLEDIFGRKEGLNRKYNNRTSSAQWDADSLTLVEKRSYRKLMGYDKNAATPTTSASNNSSNSHSVNTASSVGGPMTSLAAMGNGITAAPINHKAR